MSVLAPHIRAARALAEAFAFEANECGDERNALLLVRMSASYTRAADDLQAQQQAEYQTVTQDGCYMPDGPFTHEFIHSCRHTRRQLAAWGLSWPPQSGWVQRLIDGSQP